MFETFWPRLRTYVRLLSFLAGFGLVIFSILSIFGNAYAFMGGEESVGIVGFEMLGVVGGCMWMLLMTKI
jgi:hypothetical protein